MPFKRMILTPTQRKTSEYTVQNMSRVGIEPTIVIARASLYYKREPKLSQPKT